MQLSVSLFMHAKTVFALTMYHRVKLLTVILTTHRIRSFLFAFSFRLFYEKYVLKSITDSSRQLQMDMFFSFAPSTALFLFPPFYFLIQILLIKLWEPAGLLPPPPSSQQLSHREHKEREESPVRERHRGWTEGGFMAALLCFLSVSWLCEWSSSEEPNTPPKLSLNPHRVHPHTRTHKHTHTHTGT